MIDLAPAMPAGPVPRNAPAVRPPHSCSTMAFPRDPGQKACRPALDRPGGYTRQIIAVQGVHPVWSEVQADRRSSSRSTPLPRRFRCSPPSDRSRSCRRSDCSRRPDVPRPASGPIVQRFLAASAGDIGHHGACGNAGLLDQRPLGSVERCHTIDSQGKHRERMIDLRSPRCARPVHLPEAVPAASQLRQPRGSQNYPPRRPGNAPPSRRHQDPWLHPGHARRQCLHGSVRCARAGPAGTPSVRAAIISVAPPALLPRPSSGASVSGLSVTTSFSVR